MKLPKFCMFSILMLLVCTAFASFDTGPPGDEQSIDLVVQDFDLVTVENLSFVALLNKPTVPIEIEVLESTNALDFAKTENAKDSNGLFYRRARDGC